MAVYRRLSDVKHTIGGSAYDNHSPPVKTLDDPTLTFTPTLARRRRQARERVAHRGPAQGVPERLLQGDATKRQGAS